MALRTLSLCSGIGGIELGIRSLARTRTVCYVERDSYAAAVLVARMESQDLDQAPIWSDLRTFDAASWRGKVDLVTAGFPCQPWSAAGKHAGTDDDRWLWPAIFRIVCDVGARCVFLENVPGLVNGGIQLVLGDLATRGFDAEWDCFTAEQVGAPHLRERLFLLAWDVSDAGCDILRQQPERGERAPRSTEPGDSQPGELGAEVADADGWGCEGQRVEEGSGKQGARRDESDRCCRDRRRQGAEVGDSSGAGREVRVRKLEEPTGHRFPPGPSGLLGWDGPKPSIRRSDDGVRYRLDRLRCLGNAVVPQQAALAWETLNRRRT